MFTVIGVQQIRAREARIRRALNREGYALRKSRLRGWPTPDNHGEYMIVDPTTNFPVVGWNYDYSLDDVEEWLNRETV